GPSGAAPGGSGPTSAGGANSSSAAGTISSSPAGPRPSAGSSAAGPPSAQPAAQGLFGTAQELRIDRSARPNWDRAVRDVDPQETATVADWPTTVRYFFIDGDRLTSEQLAAQGVGQDPPTTDATGLYREIIPTAALAENADTDPLARPAQGEDASVELLAPEVVNLELSYSDGQQFVEAWNSSENGGLPAGIEIRLTIYQPAPDEPAATDDSAPPQRDSQYAEKELVEFRRFVRLTPFTPSQPADALLPPPSRPAAAGGSLNGQSPAGASSAGGANAAGN
ncbi:MAG: hypothetical protein IT424_00205, partial [Pirellulales bacterium]|nr:hypothetical protein [Pirellulales bacterium]